MGLLDDAIREHLELKRMHGASDDDIARAEQEALTPARRDSSGAGVPPLEEVPGAGAVAAGDLPPPPPAPGEETHAPAPPPPADDADLEPALAYEDAAAEPP